MSDELTPGSTPGRRRSQASRQAILQSTYELLNTVGFNQMSIEGVASLAGVGKATIYRWWGNKGVLAVEAFMEAITPSIIFHVSDSARNDIERQMNSLAVMYRGRTGEIFAEMIGCSQSNPEMREAFFDGYLKPRREAAKDVLRRGIQQGEFRTGLDLDTVVDALYGPMVYRMLAGYYSINDEFIKQTGKFVLDGLSNNGNNG